MSRARTRLAALDLSDLPLVAAPMAGGPTTVALARAVGSAGGFAFLAGGYKTPDALRAEINELSLSSFSFGVNLFVPDVQNVDLDAFRAYSAHLQPDADRYNLRLATTPTVDDDHWSEKLAILRQDPVPVVSLTFGIPARGDIAQLQRVGSRVLATVTTPAEAQAAEEAGVDGLVVQGSAAGGHSGIHNPTRDPAPLATVDLVAQILARVDLPVIAAGGVDGPDAVRRLLQGGAEAVAVGTLLLPTDEAGTNPVHRAALADSSFNKTVLTRAFTGRPARALCNGFINRHDQQAPTAYPAIHHLTKQLRQAAAAAADTDVMHLWAGTGYRRATPATAAQVINNLTKGL